MTWAWSMHASYRVAGFHEPPPLPDLHDASYYRRPS